MIFFLRAIILVIALGFAIGAFLAWQKELDADTYIIVTGVVGSLASVLGLIALSAPKLTASDVRNVEAELLKSVADQVQSAKEYDEKLANNREELTKLEAERAEIELLVRQASLKLFMEERLRHLAAEIDKRITADAALNEMLDNYKVALQRVEELNGELQRSEKGDVVQQILDEVRATSGKRPLEIYLRFMGNRINIGPALESYFSFVKKMTERMIH